MTKASALEIKAYETEYTKQAIKQATFKYFGVRLLWAVKPIP